MTQTEALRLALEALEDLARYEHPQTMIQIRKKDGGSIVTMYPHKVASDAITAIKAALEAKDEPVAWMYDWTTSEGEFIQNWTTSEAETLRDTEPTIITNVRPLYTTPPQRTWVGLTTEEREQVQTESYGKVPHHVALIAAVEAKLKEKNT